MPRWFAGSNVSIMCHHFLEQCYIWLIPDTHAMTLRLCAAIYRSLIFANLLFYRTCCMHHWLSSRKQKASFFVVLEVACLSTCRSYFYHYTIILCHATQKRQATHGWQTSTLFPTDACAYTFKVYCSLANKLPLLSSTKENSVFSESDDSGICFIAFILISYFTTMIYTTKMLRNIFQSALF